MELQIKLEDISIVQGEIKFPTYSTILQSAEKLNERLMTVEVTEENIQESKRLIAQVRKEANKLETIRKDIKKQINEPYTAFEQMVKEITSTVSEGENIIRSQVRAMEEEQRLEKHNQLLSSLNRRLKHYPRLLEVGVDVEQLITPELLNKSVTLDKAEITLVGRIEEISNNLLVIDGLEHSVEVMVEYVASLDLAKSILTVQTRHEKMAEIKVEPKAEVITTRSITLFNDADYIKVVEFLNLNNIKYK